MQKLKWPEKILICQPFKHQISRKPQTSFKNTPPPPGFRSIPSLGTTFFLQFYSFYQTTQGFFRYIPHDLVATPSTSLPGARFHGLKGRSEESRMRRSGCGVSGPPFPFSSLGLRSNSLVAWYCQGVMGELLTQWFFEVAQTY